MATADLIDTSTTRAGRTRCGILNSHSTADARGRLAVVAPARTRRPPAPPPTPPGSPGSTSR